MSWAPRCCAAAPLPPGSTGQPRYRLPLAPSAGDQAVLRFGAPYGPAWCWAEDRCHKCQACIRKGRQVFLVLAEPTKKIHSERKPGGLPRGTFKHPSMEFSMAPKKTEIMWLERGMAGIPVRLFSYGKDESPIGVWDDMVTMSVETVPHQKEDWKRGNHQLPTR
jgi:hypothetical protein